MYPFERLAVKIRHHSRFVALDFLWNFIRPVYDLMIKILGKKGLERVMNGYDRILVAPECRGISETYEPEVWKHLMAAVKQSDTVVDIGAHIGLYTIALAQRVGPKGKVIAFEPDPYNFIILKKNIELNNFSDRVELVQAAVADRDSMITFRSEKGCESHILNNSEDQGMVVKSMRLDTFLSGKRVDLMKIDVEGYEELVLRSAEKLLKNHSRKPSRIYIEVHPHDWNLIPTSSHSLLDFLRDCNYQVVTLEGAEVNEIKCWSEILAVDTDRARRND